MYASGVIRGKYQYNTDDEIESSAADTRVELDLSIDSFTIGAVYRAYQQRQRKGCQGKGRRRAHTLFRADSLDVAPGGEEDDGATLSYDGNGRPQYHHLPRPEAIRPMAMRRMATAHHARGSKRPFD